MKIEVQSVNDLEWMMRCFITSAQPFDIAIDMCNQIILKSDSLTVLDQDILLIKMINALRCRNKVKYPLPREKEMDYIQKVRSKQSTP